MNDDVAVKIIGGTRVRKIQMKIQDIFRDTILHNFAILRVYDPLRVKLKPFHAPPGSFSSHLSLTPHLPKHFSS